MVELAIAWLLANPLVSSVIAGATKPEQVIANAKAADWSLTPEEMDSTGIGPGTMRVSCGLEHPDDVIADIEQALAAASD